MDIDAIIQHLETNDFFSSGILPVHTSGLYCMYRKHVALTTSSSRVVIQFERMDLNDMSLYEKYDDLFHVTEYINDSQIHESKSETMTPQQMESLVRHILVHILVHPISEIIDISFG